MNKKLEDKPHVVSRIAFGTIKKVTMEKLGGTRLILPRSHNDSQFGTRRELNVHQLQPWISLLKQP